LVICDESPWKDALEAAARSAFNNTLLREEPARETDGGRPEGHLHSSLASSASANEAAGARSGELVAFDDDLAADEGGEVAAGALAERLAACGKVAREARAGEGERFEIDHVEIGLLAGENGAAIGKAHVARGVVGLHLDHLLEREPTLRPVARPVGEEEGRK